MDNAKITFVQKAQGLINALASLDDTMQDMNDVWNARAYGPGLPNAFTDAELAALEGAGGHKMSADDLYAFIILCDQARKFIHGDSAAVINNYAATISKLRTDY